MTDRLHRNACAPKKSAAPRGAPGVPGWVARRAGEIQTHPLHHRVELTGIAGGPYSQRLTLAEESAHGEEVQG